MQPEELPQHKRKDERDELRDKLERLVIKKQESEQRIRRLRNRLKGLEEPDRKS